MKWSVGDKVMAKWPGSALYFHAQILSVDDDDKEVQVLFSEGSEMKLPFKYIESEQKFTPRNHSKSPGRSRRRSRSRSPGRSPSRKNITAQRLTMSPKQRSRSESRGRVTTKLVTSSSEEKKAFISRSEKKLTNIITSTTSKINLGSGETHFIMTRQRRKMAVTTATDKNSSNHQQLSFEPVIKEYGGVMGTSLIYLIAPLLSLWMILVCLKADWSISKFKTSMIPSNLASYSNINVFTLLMAFLLFQAILYVLPLGHVIKGSPTLPNGARLEYRISARYALVISALAYGGMCYYDVPTTYVEQNLFQFACTTTVLCFTANFLVYAWSFYVPKHELNPSGDTGSWIYDSFIGRIFHPRFGKLFDLKLFLYRPSMIGWMLLVWVAFHGEYAISAGKLSPQFWIISISQMAYIFFVFFFDEDMCVFMFDIKDESLGFPQFIGEMIMVPFLYSIPVRYVVAHPTNLSIAYLLLVISLFCAGMVFILWSGKQKSMFRKNPSSFPSQASLPSSRIDGERLLVSGLWGFLRHPNYFGEVLIALSWSLACGFTHAITWFYPLFVIGLLCDRAARVEKRCEEKHGHAWKMYCERVHYKVFPGVF